jgi:hypothetical protein
VSNRFFDWVASASRFISYTWARASEVNASLDNVSTGFELVQDEIDENKTRSIRLPVGQDGDITTTSANRARRVLTFDASGLPYIFPPDDAATRANKVFAWDASGNPILASNGAPYAWLPSQTGNNRKILTTDGSNPSWIFNGLTRLSKTTTASLGADDNRTMVDCSGTFTVTFAAPATLEAGWYAFVRNTGTGDVTVSHTSGNIDGLTSYVMYPGEARLFQCDGSTIRSQVLQGFRLFATASTTATMPPGYSRLGFDLMGGGASGEGGASGTHAGFTQEVKGGSGGGGGGRHTGVIDPPSAGTTITISVGTGGAVVSGRSAGASRLAAPANAGGDSSIAWSSTTMAEAKGATVTTAASYGGEYNINNFGSRYTGGSSFSVNSQPAGGSSYMAAGAGGPGGGVHYNSGGSSYPQNTAQAGGKKNTGTPGGGGAAGSSGASGAAGSTAPDSGGGGGGYGNTGAGGNGAAGTGYGSGGGGGGACLDGSAAGGNGGAGVDGFACISGVV